MSSGYEDEMEVTPPKKTKKTIIKRPSKEELKEESSNEIDEAPKKISVKAMVHEALTDLKSRKGTSLYAIKKYMHENYDVDVAKVNYIIKKLIKSEVEAGIIVQVNGIGATGSFKLAPAADKQKTKPKTKKVEKKITKKTEDKKDKIKTTKTDTKVKTKKSDKILPEVEKEKKKSVKRKLEITEDKKEKTVRIKTTQQSKSKIANTPHKKKAAMSKRKSIGSIIKPPKMKPKA
ncbi:PREDICTED: histone H1.1, embryonic-like [Papilio polytes]|uniref:histone H1.1, embryonic-like n=1 Tax=Papilio polytes TaxID=76194 RepID=UPI0006769546|nr:PREDICTED: histone H1.1, embryonic-like [Papilio polytes]